MLCHSSLVLTGSTIIIAKQTALTIPTKNHFFSLGLIYDPNCRPLFNPSFFSGQFVPWWPEYSANPTFLCFYIVRWRYRIICSIINDYGNFFNRLAVTCNVSCNLFFKDLCRRQISGRCRPVGRLDQTQECLLHNVRVAGTRFILFWNEDFLGFMRKDHREGFFALSPFALPPLSYAFRIVSHSIVTSNLISPSTGTFIFQELYALGSGFENLIFRCGRPGWSSL